MFHGALHFCLSQFPYISVLLFHGFDTINDNCYYNQTLYTGRVNNACAAEQEGCYTVLEVGKYHKPNSSFGIRDINRATHTAQFVS